MKIPLIFALVALFAGCASDGFKKGHGDVGAFILQQATMRGGKPVTNSLPSIDGAWRFSEDEAGVVIRMSRAQYPAVENFLRAAFGTPKLGPEETDDGGRLGVYRLSDKGGGIQFSCDAKQTQVIVIRPVSMEEIFRGVTNAAKEIEKSK